MSNKMDKILTERGKRYGIFAENAAVAQEIKKCLRNYLSFEKMQGDQREALDMIATKISRILTGDCNYADNWRDIEGFARLIAERLEQEQN